MWHEDDRMMEVYTAFENDGGPFPRVCPVCGQSHAHVLMHRIEPSGLRGTVWVWCDSCAAYVHFSAVIPALWSNPAFVDEDRLDSFVDYPDTISTRIDEWVSALHE